MRARFGASALVGALLSVSGLFLATASATAVDDTGSTTAGTPVTVDVKANDTPSCIGQGFPNVSCGSSDVRFAGGTSATAPEGTWQASGGSITYTPADGFEGTASIDYVYDYYSCAVSCGATEGSEGATLTITVGPSAEVPIVSAPVAGAAAALAALAGGVWIVRRRGFAG